MSIVTIRQRLPRDEAPHGAARERLVLPFELRARSRLRAQLESGEEVGLVLERGGVLRNGDLLCTADWRVVEIVAAPEEVSIVSSGDPAHLARAAYHLGNRHVALQVGHGWLRYLHDHVLDDMVRGMGFTVTFDTLPFEPESGAYSTATTSDAGRHSHHGDHDADHHEAGVAGVHSHDHSHDH